VVLVLRCWRGTTLSNCDTSVFWLLANRLGELALEQPPGRLLMLVLCRTLPGEAEAGEGAMAWGSVMRTRSMQTRRLSIQHDILNLQPLSNAEARTFAGLVLGVGGPRHPEAQAPEAPEVPEELMRCLRGLALNNPRNIQEMLAQLLEENKIRVAGGRVEVRMEDLGALDVSDWVHTSMVCSIISRVEMLGAEAQRVIKMATVFDGPFSALDVAAANRVHRPNSDLLAFHDSVQLLLTCEWLVAEGFLTRFDAGPRDPLDGQSWRLPRWEIANLLIRRVVGATLLQSQRMQVKRAVLVSRALNIHLPIKMREKAEMREELFGKQSKAERSRQQRRRDGPGRGQEPEPRPSLGAPTGLPSSCIVLPMSVAMEPTATEFLEGFRRPDHRLHAGRTVAVGRDRKATPPASRMASKAQGDHGTPGMERMADWLHLMCAAAHRDRVMQLLRRSAPVTMRDAAGLSALHFACSRGDVEVARALVQAAADPRMSAPSLGTPLEVATAHGHLEVARYLVDDAGALPLSLDTADAWQETPDVPMPILASDLPAWNRLEEANYRRAQMLTLLQDAIAAAEEAAERQERSSQIKDPDPVSRAALQVPAQGLLAGLAHSRLMAALMALAVLMALFGPDVWVLVGGSQEVLDSLLCAVIVLFALQIALFIATQPGYIRTLFFFLDVAGTAAVALDVSWLLGPSDRDPMEPDRPLDGRSGNYNAVLARTARGAELGNWAARYSWAVRLINVLCVCCLPPDGNDFGGVEVFRKQLMRTISSHVATFTVLLVVILPLTSFMTMPSGDGSMLAWVEILSGRRNASAGAWAQELTAFEDFYDQLSYYGPYHLCLGAPESGSFRCGLNGTVWGLDARDEARHFTQPEVGAARVSVHSDSLRALFDFTLARRREAERKIAFVVFAFTVMVFTTFFISRAISDLVLRPLQRMLISVTRIAQPLLGDSSALGLDREEDVAEALKGDEISTLERLVQKLGKIAGIAAELSVGRDLASMELLKDEDRGVMQMVFRPKDKRAETPKPSHFDADPLPGEEMRGRLSALRLSFEELDSWDFNVLRIDRKQAAGVTGWILLQNTVAFGEVQLPPEAALRFLQALAQHYLPENAYHNWLHAVDVLHTLWLMLLTSEAHAFLTGLDQFALLVSAISHDVGHPGVSNQFLVETGHELAVRYNDRSPLENMHCAKTFSIASGTPGANPFETLSRPDFFEVRRICIETILHTDMVHHFEMIKETQVLYQMNSDVLEKDPAELFQQKDTKQKVMNLFLHAADVSNPCKPWEICREWAMCVLEEFFSQGDKEKQLGLPVQMLNDRTKVNKPFSQIGFIEFMLVPLEAAKVKLFPSLSELTDFLRCNMQEWNRLWTEEEGPTDEEKEKVMGRIQKASEVLAQAQASNAAYRYKSKPDVLEEPAHDRLTTRARVSTRVSSEGGP